MEKKIGATDCSDIRTVSLIRYASKIVLGILKKRITSKADEYLGEDQYGFRRGNGTREAIAAMRIICKRSLERDQEVNIYFVDFEKAFDRIRWDKLMEILKKIGVDWRERRLIKELYMGQVVAVRTNAGETDLIEIGRRTRQGCPSSPVLFNLYDKAMIREAFDDLEEGINIGGNLIKEIRFADDKGVLTSTQELFVILKFVSVPFLMSFIS